MNRTDWESLADSLLRDAWKWASPGRAFLDLPGRPSANGARSDGLEGYARTFLAAAFRVAGGGDPHGWLERYADGLAAGTGTGPEAWPEILDLGVQGQPMVESASIALSLRLTRPWLWDLLPEDVQDRAEAWLRGALRHTPAPNNWHLFPYTVAGFLEAAGRGDAETARVRRRALDLLDSWYRGDGWYTDGDDRCFDHYNGWALHLYPVLDAHLSGAETVHGGRLHDHLKTCSLLFDANGAPLYFGRSLTYRWAAVTPVALGAVTGHTPLAPGASRRLVNGALRYFLDRRALDADGLLTPGWHGPHTPTLQPYSGPASPYWATKAFVALLAPAGHPLWTSPEEPAPSEGAPRAVALPTGLLIQTHDGLARLHNHGSDHIRPYARESAEDDDPLYGRLSYSTRTGPTSAPDPADNHFALEIGGLASVRRRVHPLATGQGDGWAWAASRHHPVFRTDPPMVPGLHVDSLTLVMGAHELRVHRVVGAPHGARVTETGPAASVPAALHPVHGWASADEVDAPHGTAFIPAARLSRLTGTAEGTALFACSSTPAVTVVAATADRLDLRWTSDGPLFRISFDPPEVASTGSPPRHD